MEDRSRRQAGNRLLLTCLHAVVIYKTRATSLIHKLIALNYHRRILFTEFFSHTRKVIVSLTKGTLYFLCLSRFLLLKTTSFRLFLFIIFSFQNFRYHSGITNGYQCSYWYYDSDEVNLQVVNSKYSSPQPTNILYIIQLPFILLIFFIQFPKKISRSLSHITK